MATKTSRGKNSCILCLYSVCRYTSDVRLRVLDFQFLCTAPNNWCVLAFQEFKYLLLRRRPCSRTILVSFSAIPAVAYAIKH